MSLLDLLSDPRPVIFAFSAVSTFNLRRVDRELFTSGQSTRYAHPECDRFSGFDEDFDEDEDLPI